MISLLRRRQDKFSRKSMGILQEIGVAEPAIQSNGDSHIKEFVLALKTTLADATSDKGRDIIEGIPKNILIEAIALVREASRQVLGKRTYDEQICAGIALFQGSIIEMPNGEGKTLAATVPVFLESLKGGRTHIATANKYLATRDANWMGPVYHRLGLSVGLLTENTSFISNIESTGFELLEIDSSMRNEVYDCDIIYGTAESFTSDFLYDNLTTDLKRIRQINGLDFIIIDEIDSVLIDQARTNYSITQRGSSDIEKYDIAYRVANSLAKGEDYSVDKAKRKITISDAGIRRIERFLKIPNIYAPKLLRDETFRGILPMIKNAIEAREFFTEGVHYIVQKSKAEKDTVENNKIVPVDQTTGRPAPGQVFTSVHQALQIKHKIPPSPESVDIATITYQKFFCNYNKLAGMTGTAIFDKYEYRSVYGKDVTVIPPRFHSRRIDKDDVVFKTNAERVHALVNEVATVNQKKQPILLGTLNTAMAENIAKALKNKGIQYELLDAKHHEREAEIIEKAGQLGAVTISAKMAGRGTDIKLADGANELGGLHVIGVGRNESRRLDEQLKGRAGRHGCKGSTQFFLSFDDDLLSVFAPEWTVKMLSIIGWEENVPIYHRRISKGIKKAQDKLTRQLYDTRSRILKFDQILDFHRSNIYSLRRRVLESEDLLSEIDRIFHNVIYRILIDVSRRTKLKQKHILAFIASIEHFIDSKIQNPFERYSNVHRKELIKWAKNIFGTKYQERRKDKKRFPEGLARMVLLDIINASWKNHLKNVDSLGSTLSLKWHLYDDTLAWYKSENNKIFDGLISSIEYRFCYIIFRVAIRREAEDQI